MLKRSQYIALAVVIMTLLILLNLPDRTKARLKVALGSLFLPLSGLSSSAGQVADKTGDAIVTRAQLLRENEALRLQNEQLRLEALQAAEMARENARLRQLFAWKQEQKWNLKLGHVVLRDPANWWRTVQIDLGSRDGMRTNLPVLTPQGLVGRISTVMFDRSQVVLIGDPNCKIAAQVENGDRDMGIVEAASPFDGALVEMSYLPKSADVRPGQNVYTSGKGGIFPKGIPVGKIVDSRQIEYGLYVEARLKIHVNLSALDEVWVLMQ